MKNYITHTTISDKTLITNQNTNQELILDESGTEIWKLVVEGKDKLEVINTLHTRYSSTKIEIISKDVNDFYDVLQEYGIIEER